MLVGFRAEAWDLLEVGARGEGAVGGAVVDDVLRELWAETGDVCQEVTACGVDLHAYLVDAAYDDGVEGGL